MRVSIATTACLLSAISTVYAVNTIEVRGQDFVDSVTNDRFVIIGVDYQPGGQGAYGEANSQDPLSNATACLRDAALMQELGVNTIRTYNVDPTLNHDECASIFDSVGIYMILDVNSPLSGESIDRSNPYGTYSTSYLEHIFSVVESFKSYPNTLAFFAGNEVINDIPTAQNGNPNVMRAVVRDIKNYLKNNSPRQIPVGYSAADVREVLQDTWEYMQCAIDGDESDMSRSDFFGLNSYSWCGGDATFSSAGYDVLATMFANTSVPVFFSEYGCNEVTPRVFDEVQALYSPEMTVMSGGLIYEWSQEPSNYGLVTIYSNGSLQLLGDFAALQGQYNKVNVTLLENSNATATGIAPPTCASSLISDDGFSSDFDIPSPPDGAEDVISSGISNAPTGSIVPVTRTQVDLPIYATNGALINDLVIRASNGSNTPSGEDTGSKASASPSSSASSASSASRTQSDTPTSTGSSGASSAATATSTGAANALVGIRASGALAVLLGAGMLAL
ncbi:hypothetical protein AAFC00_003105 [Neodothiora populina]|uniref:1,3-beta-glucanosyltransferase n=1 Tax=Neodothiora populina TaxID=2781224 RepID=A0ABR3P9B0_9PEZI